MDLTTAVEFAGTRRQSVLTTIRGNGRPQLSNVSHHVSDDGLIRISITADRAKYKNLVRDPRASLWVPGDNFYVYAVIEGDVTLSDVAADPHDAAVGELVDLYRAIGGEHPDWDEYRTAMVSDHRVVVRVRPTHTYGQLPD